MAKTDTCKHSAAIECANHSSCARCGWNPKERDRRVEYIRKHRTTAGMLKVKPKTKGPGRPNGGAKTAVVATNIETGEVKRYGSLYAAKKDGFQSACILMCLRGERGSHHGWKFERVGGREWS